MTRRDYMNYLERVAVEYVKDAKVSIVRNKHMNKLTGKERVSQKIIDAVIVDFINVIGAWQGLDEGYYVKDLYKER